MFDDDDDDDENSISSDFNEQDYPLGVSASRVDFSLEDLEALVSQEEDQLDIADEDEDTAGSENELALKEAGYIITDDMSMKVLQALCDREEIIGKINKGDFNRALHSMLADLNGTLTSSRATLPENQSNSDDIVNLAATLYSDAEELAFIVQPVCAIISNLCKTNTNVTADQVFEELLNNPVFSSDKAFQANTKKIRKNVEYITPLLVARYQQNRKESEQRTAYRQQVVQTTLPFLFDMLEQTRNHCYDDVSIIRQVIRKENKNVIVCGGCSETFILETPILSLVLADAERPADRVKKVVPRPIVCPHCGKIHFFLPNDYENVESVITDKLSRIINSAIDFSNSFSVGSSIISSTPTNDNVLLIISYLMVQTADSISSDSYVNINVDSIVNGEKIIKSVEQVVTTNTNEYVEAAINFYKLLNALPDTFSSLSANNYSSGFDDNTNSAFSGYSAEQSSLDYHKAALILATNAGNSYKDLKNAAVFSLLIAIRDNSILSKYLLPNSEASYYCYDQFMKTVSADKVTNLPPQTYRQVASIYYAFMKDETPFDPDNKAQYDFIVSQMESLNRVIQSIRSDFTKTRRCILESMQKLEECLAFTKILKIDSISLQDLLSLFTPSNTDEILVFNLIDRITDKMVINHCAESFYESWSLLDIVSKTSINQAIVQCVDSKKINTTITNALKPLLKNVVHSTVIEKVFHRVKLLSASSLEQLHELSTLYKAMKYYDFCHLLAGVGDTLKSSLDSIVSEEVQHECIYMVSALVTNCVNAIRLNGVLLTEQQFYLGQKGAGFTDEELASYEGLDQIHFARYVPFRLKGESLADYVSRYKQLIKDNKLSILNSRDYLSEFDKFSDYSILLTFGSSLYAAELNSYTKTMFISCLVDLCCNHLSEKHALSLLGLNSNVIKMYYENDYSFASDVCENKSLLQTYFNVVNGIYLTTIDSYVFDMQNSLETFKVHSHDDLSKVMSFYDIKGTFTEFSMLPDNIRAKPVAGDKRQPFVADDDLDYDSKESAFSELLCYIEDPEIRELF